MAALAAAAPVGTAVPVSTLVARRLTKLDLRDRVHVAIYAYDNDIVVRGGV